MLLAVLNSVCEISILFNSLKTISSNYTEFQMFNKRIDKVQYFRHINICTQYYDYY